MGMSMTPDGDREALAFVRKWIDTDESEGVQRTVINELNDLIASHVATRLAAVEAERDALSKDRDSWKVMAECLDVKVLHEQIDHNKTIDGPLALARAERDALRATVAKMREALEEIHAEGVGALNNAFPEDAPEIVESMAQKAEVALKNSLSPTPLPVAKG
jgi:hypothetical protein